MSVKIIQAVLPRRVGRFLVTYGYIYDADRERNNWYIRLWYRGVEKLIAADQGEAMTAYYNMSEEQAEELWERD